MPNTIEYIDAIARKKQRTVLYILFTDPNAPVRDDPIPTPPPVNWRVLPIRKTIIDWLDANDIEWDLCGDVADTRMMVSYRGQIYIDIPFDLSSPKYQALAEFLEFPDGTSRFPEVGFHYLPLDVAMRNAHHDEPGFWEKWADQF
jgi:hypothetical protein